MPIFCTAIRSIELAHKVWLRISFGYRGYSTPSRLISLITSNPGEYAKGSAGYAMICDCLKGLENPYGFFPKMDNCIQALQRPIGD